MKKSKTPMPDTPDTPEMSIVVPVLNEAGNIIPLVEAIGKTFEGRNIEIIYVDDGSTDNTAQELLTAQKQEPRLRILSHSSPAGQSAALRKGIFAATAPLIGTLDGDMQNPPDDLLVLEKAVHANRPGLVMVAGVRANRQDSASKYIASRLGYFARRLILGEVHPDTGCATKVFDREIYIRLPFFNTMHRFIVPLARRENAKVIGMPVSHAARKIGKSKYGNLDRLMAGVIDILGVIWLMHRAPKQSRNINDDK